MASDKPTIAELRQALARLYNHEAGANDLSNLSRALDDLEQATPPSGDRGATHWPGCHKRFGHHSCALHLLEQAQQDLGRPEKREVR